MYNLLYKGPRPTKVDVFTACQVSVDLNPQPFINREELRVYQKNTRVAMTALKSHKIEVSKPCQNTTVALPGQQGSANKKRTCPASEADPLPVCHGQAQAQAHGDKRRPLEAAGARERGHARQAQASKGYASGKREAQDSLKIQAPG